MGPATREFELYGSPYGGQAVGPNQVPEIRVRHPVLFDRRPTEEVSPDEDIQMRVFQRIINDILKGRIDPDALKRLEDMKPSNTTHTPWFTPVA